MHFSPPPYLDPGSGSFILQILIAALLGIGVAFRASWSRIKSFFTRKKSEDDTTENDQD